jgi:hypothetical protein
MTEETGEPGEPKSGGPAIDAVAAGIGAYAGLRLGSMGGMVAGAAGAPYLAWFMRRSLGELFGDRVCREEEALRTAGESSGLPPDEFSELAGRTERTRFLTDSAIRAAADADWPPSVRAIGRALADGLIHADDTIIDILKLVLPAMTEMTASQVQLLDVMIMSRPQWDGRVTRAERIEDRPWLAETKTTWSAREITAVLPNLEPVLLALIAGLERRGLIEQNDVTAEALARYSENFRNETNRTNPPGPRTSQPQRTQFAPPALHPIQAQRLTPPQSWSPTRLGEQVLGYYELAARPGGQTA